jgi:hypothetical protein
MVAMLIITIVESFAKGGIDNLHFLPPLIILFRLLFPLASPLLTRPLPFLIHSQHSRPFLCSHFHSSVTDQPRCCLVKAIKNVEHS